MPVCDIKTLSDIYDQTTEHISTYVPIETQRGRKRNRRAADAEHNARDCSCKKRSGVKGRACKLTRRANERQKRKAASDLLLETHKIF